MGNFGYGHAKQELYELICDKFKEQREKFNHLMENKEIIDLELSKGAKKARVYCTRGITKSKKKYRLLKWIKE